MKQVLVSLLLTFSFILKRHQNIEMQRPQAHIVFKPSLSFFKPTKSAEAQGAGGRGPLNVAHRVHVGHMFATRCLPWKQQQQQQCHHLQQQLAAPQSAGVEPGTYRRGSHSLLSW